MKFLIYIIVAILGISVDSRIEIISVVKNNECDFELKVNKTRFKLISKI